VTIIPLAIATLDDPRLADYRHVASPQHLQAAGLFVAEGRLVVRRLMALPRWETQSVLVTQPALDSLQDALGAAASQAPVYVVSQTLMNDVAGFNIHRGCLALARRPAAAGVDDGALAQAARVLVLEGVNNPDNVGGLFRSAAAFGADLVLLGPSCGDPLYRKAVRTSMGATLVVPFAEAGPWPDVVARMRATGFHVLALTPDASAVALADARPAGARVAVLLGAEGEGLTAAAMAAATARVRIPMAAGSVDSLNVATAGSIAMYHAFGLH